MRMVSTLVSGSMASLMVMVSSNMRMEMSIKGCGNRELSAGTVTDPKISEHRGLTVVTGVYTYAAYGNTYTGEWKDDRRDGQGIYETTEGAKYEGQWSQGCQHGDGFVSFQDGSVYKGQWVMDNEDGFGVAKSANGEIYAGEWKNSLKHGEGVLHFPDGTCYSGKWSEGHDTHEGTFLNSDGSELGSNLPKETMMGTPEYQSSKNQRFSVDFPFYFSQVKSSGEHFGTVSQLDGRRGVPTTDRLC